MSKHTPGPWEVDRQTVYALESAGFYRGVERFQNRFSALVQSPRASGPELEANASLIAAAPELLEALRMWMDIHEKPAGFAGKYGKALDAAIHDQQVKVDAAAAAARAAIAKARGEA